MSWKISKQFNFSYGHRVATQVLVKEFSIDRQCICRHHHGHEAEVHVHLVGDDLNPQGMITDFLNLQWLKKFFDDFVDHKYFLWKDDPLYKAQIDNPLFNLYPLNGMALEFKTPVDVFVPDTEHSAGKIFPVRTLLDREAKYGLPLELDQSVIDHYESFFIVDFIPTSENLSKWVYDLVEPKMARIGVKVGEVEWWETPKSCSRYGR